MNQTDLEALTSIIQSTWNQLPSAKVTRYISKFFDRSRIGKRITAKVHGNYGVYIVSIDAKKSGCEIRLQLLHWKGRVLPSL